MKAEHAAHDRLGHEQRLAEALGALVQQSTFPSTATGSVTA